MKLVDDSLELEKQIFETHFMSYLEFCETKLLYQNDEEGYCYRCGKLLEPLTYYEPNFYYQPCWDCANKRRSDRELITEGLLRNIKEFYNKILGDRFFQLFISDNLYYTTTYPHTFSTFKKVVSALDPPGRNDFWFLDWKPGYPKLIALENIPGIQIVNVTDKYNIELEKDMIKVGDYKILMPEDTVFDPKHHYRYSILNKNGDRKSKRFRIGDRCIKFYNTEDDNTKAIFKVLKNDEEVALRSLTYEDFVILKLAIMRNKNFLRLIFDVILEVSKSVGILKDSIFLKNTIILESKKKDQVLNIIWNPLCENKKDNYINISII